MPELDLLIRGAQPLPEIGIAGERIVGFEAGSAREEIDASGLLVLPGVVDAHVHFNEPGRTDWEGWETGSRGAIAGGVTTVCDMPLNSTPPVVTGEAFDAKRSAAQAKSVCDFAFWAGLIPQNVDKLEELAMRGVMGFKAFMAHSGIDDFPKVNLETLRAGMIRAAELALPIAVHAEFDRDLPRRGTTARDYLASRPIEMETDAIRAALEICGETGCALHVVHVSSSEGVELITDAKKRGANVSCEICAHYLLFTGGDMERLGAVAKCAPPMRDQSNLARLWKCVRSGHVDTVGSDHSPSPWELKAHGDFFKAWGGISGVQHLLPALLDAGLEPSQLALLASQNPARRFSLPQKGKLEVGADADLALVEFGESLPVSAADLFYRHKHSPYIGRCLRARVRRTILRGKTVFDDGKITSTGGGRLVKPL